MIKEFISTVDDAAQKAMWRYIDRQNDERKEEIKELKKELKLLKDNQTTFEDTKKVVEAYSNLSKTVKKAAVGAIVTTVIGFILYQIGIGGG